MPPVAPDGPPSVEDPMLGGHVRGFDGIRAICTAMVLYTHMGLQEALPQGGWLREQGWPLISGWPAVRAFFVISGFLITRMLLLERERTGTISFKRFYIRRALRLSPAFVLLMVLMGVWRTIGLCDTEWWAMLVSFCYLYNYMPTIWYDGLLGHTWTLAVEEQFYLLWPLALHRFTVKRLDVILVAVIVLSALVSCFLPDVLIPGSRNVHFAQLFHVTRWFIPAAGPIAIGVLTCLHLGPMMRFLRPGWRLLLIPVLYAVPLWIPTALVPVAYLVQSAGLALALIWLLQKQESLFVRFLEWRPLAYIGKLSYGIYLYHLLFVVVEHPAPIFHPPFNIVAILVVAVLSYELVELPILRLKERFR